MHLSNANGIKVYSILYLAWILFLGNEYAHIS